MNSEEIQFPTSQPTSGDAQGVPIKPPPVRPQVVDVHCHVLPGVDDGPPDLEASLALCRALVEDGITIVCATPHEMGRYEGHNLPSQIRAMVASLNETLKAQGIPLTVDCGADVRVDGRLLELIENDQVMTIADKKKHMLLELPHETFIDLTNITRALVKRGIQPIFTHPERHHGMRARPDLLAHWVSDGMLVQVTAGSLVGKFGPNSQRNAWSLIDSGLVHIVATDAHDHVERKPCMTRAMDLLAQEISPTVARKLCIENPLEVYEGRYITTPHEHLRSIGGSSFAITGVAENAASTSEAGGMRQNGFGGHGFGAGMAGRGRQSWWSRH